MIFKRYEKTDRKILATALVLLLLSLFMIVNDGWVYHLTGADVGDLEQIGEVKSVKNDVRQRHQIAFTWSPLETENSVYQGDSIFTGNESGVVIRTKTGQEITVAPNSLVIVKTKADQISIDIGFGSVEGKVEKGQTLRITSNNSVTELQGDGATVKVDAGDGKKLLLNVLAGEVNVTSSDGSQTMRRNDAAEIDTTGDFGLPNQKGVKLIMPLADQRFRYSPDRPVEFRWKLAKKYPRTKLRVATDPDLTKALIDVNVQDGFYTAYNLPIDVPLYYQVITDGAVSDKTKFYVVGNSPVQLVSPQNGQHLYYDAAINTERAGSVVDLQWAGGSPALRYEVQVASSPVFVDAKSYKTKDMHYNLGLVAKGRYFWRVRSLDYEDTKFSEAANFRVGPEPTRILSAPLLDIASQNYLLETKISNLQPEKVHKLRNRAALALVERAPLLKWSPVAGATEYELEVSTRRDFSNIVLKKVVRGTSYSWKTTILGDYFFRVRGRGQLYKDGLYTSGKEMKVQVAPPQSIAKALTIDEVPDRQLLNAPPPPLELAWNPTILTDSYQVQFSKSPDFKDALEFFTENNTRKIQISSLGQYFWKIRSLNNKKAPISPWSTAYSIEFQRVYKDPALSSNLLAIYPRQQDSLVIVGQGASEVRFQWSTPYKEAAYRLQISYDLDFKNIAFDKVVKSNMYVLKDRLQSSVVYWRVRAEQETKLSEWTGANRFLVTYEGSPFDFQTSELLFASRAKARERQQELLAETKRALTKLRTPASKMDWQLDTPQVTFPYPNMLLASNLSAETTQEELNKQNLEKFYTQVKSYPTFTWNKVSATERYFIEIARDPKFENMVLKVPTFDPYYQWESVRPGQFYWRVQAFNDRYTRSNYSEVKPFKVEVDAPTPLSTDLFVEVFDEPREMWGAPAPFKLQWSPVIFARAYDVEISENPDFKYSKTYRTDKSAYDMKVPYSGLYYWKVKPLNEYGITIGAWSSPRSVEVIQTTRTPASVDQLTGLFPKDRTMVFVGKGEMRLPFHFVAPKSGKYRVEVSDSKDFSKIISSGAVSDRNVVRLSSEWPDGKLFWRVKRDDGAAAGRTLSSDASLIGPTLSKIYEFILKKEPLPYQK